MSEHDPVVCLRQMLDAAVEVSELAGGLSGEELARNRIIELATTRLLEVLGEAASRVPEAFREQFPELGWRQVVGLRNRVIHGYDSVNLNVIAGIVDVSVPPLILQLRRILAEFDGGPGEAPRA